MRTSGNVRAEREPMDPPTFSARHPKNRQCIPTKELVGGCMGTRVTRALSRETGKHFRSGLREEDGAWGGRGVGRCAESERPSPGATALRASAALRRRERGHPEPPRQPWPLSMEPGVRVAPRASTPPEALRKLGFLPKHLRDPWGAAVAPRSVCEWGLHGGCALTPKGACVRGGQTQEGPWPAPWAAVVLGGEGGAAGDHSPRLLQVGP